MGYLCCGNAVEDELTIGIVDQARHAPEPVFSVAEELDFHNFRSVFRAGLVDPTLQNAVMFSLAFAASGGVVNQECLVYRGRTIHYIRERMTSLDKAVSEPTIGAILLLVGVEVRDQLTQSALRQAGTDFEPLGSTWNNVPGATSYGSNSTPTHSMSNIRC